MPDRLQKILSRHGIASRREAEQMILAGRVAVNGNKVTELGTKADPESDRIKIDGKLLQTNAPKFVYLLLNKPIGVMSTCDDPQGRKTVLDILPSQYRHVYPVGRLDYNSSGALILTNNGDFANYLMHPRHHVPKTYEVWVKDIPSDRVIKQWQDGVILDGKLTLPASVNIRQIERCKYQTPRTQLQIVLSEGRNRQIRRVAEQLGHPVLSLHRVAIATISLETLKVGSYRPLIDQEIETLCPI
ncbi:MAG: pseudouridine synthase [Pseudanabaena sp.]|jgi:16S rRNA pseudouridine516 synthase|nr:rRNA pseudouridine synthase [Pseudanabaena sp. M090S1SP2A07QC]MCA6507401.1 rRNA pseudouridine synthase [Pseudanabaena sp. M172S2SP2A07QC]MCA6520374.1 rRNA pseudouridine synthase [Pseudanabaena sp. M051S1SP2A07QC]MCA6525372.1 rRNA pseudouridine synthase [Pseudanabaena sp. M179S2SP2A07QC]MCA6528764.1 rRNA pseudouridine synthase [Pseudanabaena sp. M125S2SP2A07QC]MCA6536319.1 rRNA pseudouridine synthase [Pseudanabaena sp. M176S2SP2A07QC]MCA6537538.1 rRNA pseudouridine synthase [Pseudanabaena s